MAQSGAAGLLGRQLKYMKTAKDLPGISCGLVNDNVFEWEVTLMISDDCKYYGGMSLAPPWPLLLLPETNELVRRVFPLPTLFPKGISPHATFPHLPKSNPVPPQHLRLGSSLYLNSASSRR